MEGRAIPPEPRTRARRATDALVVAAFLALLLAPLVDQFARPAAARNVIVEFRTPAKLPALPRDRAQLAAFPTAFSRWFEDQFGLRDRFLFLHSYAKWFGLRTSPSPKIVRGRGGCIFVSERQALENHRGALPMSAGLLDAWQRTLEQRREWLASLGVEYLLAVSPSKMEVYPELLPERFEPIGPPRLRQLLEHLALHSDLRVLDLLPVALEAKDADAAGDSAYYPLGNHWTDRAAYAGYAAIVERLGERFPELAPLPPEAFEIELSEEQGDSWAGRIYLEDELLQQNLQWSLRAPRARLVDGRLSGPIYSARRRDGAGPRAFLYHDSFSIPMRPWLAEHFAQLDCFWSEHVDPERIVRDRPDVVIQCYNEFTLLRTTPHAKPEEDRGARAERFGRASELVWRMDPRHPAWRLRTSTGRRLPVAGERAVFEPQASDELLELPAMDYPPGANLLARLELESSVAASLSLLYRTVHDPELDSTRQVGSPVESGRQVLFLELPAEPFAGRLALRFGPPSGRWELIALEIRASTAP